MKIIWSVDLEGGGERGKEKGEEENGGEGGFPGWSLKSSPSLVDSSLLRGQYQRVAGLIITDS